MNEASEELIETMFAAAMYNDKGYMWSGHTPLQVTQIQLKFQNKLLELAGTIGEAVLGQDLLNAIVSGAVSRDDTGRFLDLAKQRLKSGT